MLFFDKEIEVGVIQSVGQDEDKNVLVLSVRDEELPFSFPTMNFKAFKFTWEIKKTC